MYKKAVVTIIIIVSLIAIGFAFLHLNQLKQFQKDYYLNVIPKNSTGFVVVNNPLKFTQQILNNTELVSDLSALPFIDSIFYSLFGNDSLQSEVKDILFDCHLALSFQQVNNVYISNYYFSFLDKLHEKRFLDWFESNSLDNRTVKVPNEFNEDVWKTQIEGISDSLFWSVQSGVLIVSRTKSGVLFSLEQIESGKSLAENNEIIDLFKTTSETALANLFINSKQVESYLKTIQKQESKFDFLDDLGEWSELDLNMTSEGISLVGFLNLGESETYLNKIFTDTQPGISKITDVIPSDAVYYCTYNLNGANSRSNFDELNKSHENLNQVFSNLVPMFDNEIASFSRINNSKLDRYLAIRIKSKTKVVEEMKSVLSKFKIPLKPIAYFKPNNETNIPIFEGFNNKELSKYLSGIADDLPDQYYSFHKDYIIFSNSISSLSDVLYDNQLKRTITSQDDHKRYLTNFSNDENYFIHIRPSYLSKSLDGIISDSLNDFLNLHMSNLEQFYGFGLQLSKLNRQVYINAYLSYEPNKEEAPKTIWESKLDTIVDSKPEFVVNHYTNEKEIIVQDAKNNLYLINNSGIILWKKPLEGKIIGGRIEQIDFYKNKKLQFVFNTQNKLYIIDRNGNFVDKYPIMLPSSATNSVSVFDYDNKMDYRFFIACKDRSVIVMNKKGNILKDWIFDRTDKEVIHPVIHSRIGNKDFIIITDDVRHYILSRRGKERVVIKQDFEPAQNIPLYEYKLGEYVSLNSDGDVVVLNIPSGQTRIYEQSSDKKLSWTFFKPLNANKNLFVIGNSKKLRLAHIDGKVVWEKNFDEEILSNVDIYAFSSNNMKIGIVDKNKKIHLYNSDGTIYKGFPLIGTSRYSIGFLSPQDKKFNLIVGGKDNFLFNYEVK